MSKHPPGSPPPPPPPPPPPDDEPDPPFARRRPGPRPPGAKGTTPYGSAAGWGSRLGATLVDIVVLVVPSALAGVIATRAGGRLAGGVAAAAVQAVYLVVLIGRSGRTVGNRAARTVVVSATSGERPDLHHSTLRWLLPGLLTIVTLVAPSVFYLSGLVLVTDILWPLWDRKNQTLHDKLAGTLVLSETASND